MISRNKTCTMTLNMMNSNNLFLEFLGLTRLYDLNVSHNQIEGEGLTSLLSAISCSSVEILNLSSTIGSHDNTFTNALALAEYLNEVRFFIFHLSSAIFWVPSAFIKEFN